jgi:hypothetical protein
LRACVKIGEISRELETARGERTDLEPSDNDVAKSKTDQLGKAGIGLRTAERYEELTGGREQQAQQVAATAMEAYFASLRVAPFR